jgi:TRAP-type C4-dicarboxylate transport system permease small subunit
MSSIESQKIYGVLDRGYGLFKTGMTALFLVMIFLAVLGILARQIERIQLLWTSTIGSALLIAIIFLGAAIAEIEDEHIQINVFRSRIVQRKSAFDHLIDGTVVIFAALIVVSAGGLTSRYWDVHWANVLWLPTGLLYLTLAFGFLLIGLYRIQGLILVLRRRNDES